MDLRGILALVLCAITAAHAFDWDEVTPLDLYVNHDDGYYGFEVMDTQVMTGFTFYLLNLTSQKWTDETYVEEHIWTHHLSIFVPHNVRFPQHAIIDSFGGYNGDDQPGPNFEPTDLRCHMFATNVGAVCAIVRQIPNAPLHFADSPRIPRVGDMAIAKTWSDYITSNDTVPNPYEDLLLPMTKSVIRAMDAIQDHVNAVHTEFDIQHFMPTGRSKRGWTAWLTACTDPRVFAVAPVVLDQLHFLPSLEHHYRAYGGWSWAFFPYWEEDVSRYLYHPRTREIFNEIAIDPIYYNERLTMPKLVTTSAGDEFFLPDDTHFFWNELNEPKWLCVFENDDHGQSRHQDEIWDNFEGFFIGNIIGFNFPRVTWTRGTTLVQSHAYIQVTTSPAPIIVRAWRADTTNNTCELPYDGATWQVCRRDFRLTQVAIPTATGITWHEEPVEHHPNGVYRVEYPYREDEGYRMFHIQMQFEGPEQRIMTLSTEVNIIPDTFPYPPCTSEEECRGTLK